MSNKTTNQDVSVMDKKAWAAYIEQSKGLERDYMAEILQSRRIWMIVALCSLMFAVAAVLYHQLNPVTKKEPFVMRVDNSTGHVDIVSTIKNQEQTYGEVVDSYFIGNYVRSYEAYNYHTIQKDYDKVMLMSAKDVANKYNAIYEPKEENKKGRDAVLGQVGKREVKIMSIVPDVKQGLATIRFQTRTIQPNYGVNTENWIATLSYQYVQADIDLLVRQINPLGFVVTSYRVDRETL